ncbi:hypothetical protein EJQ17_21530, partial [Salmonella enterica]|nr:hypothetical protein [Salmonella enterica]
YISHYVHLPPLIIININKLHNEINSIIRFFITCPYAFWSQTGKLAAIGWLQQYGVRRKKL